ncbi:MAG: Flp pilus assembly protein CpaB [candidate division FCPU426 bacterium]
MDAVKTKFYGSLLVAALAALAAWLYLGAKEKALLRRGSMTGVIAARSYLPATTRIQAKHLIRVEIPAEYVSKGAVTDPSSIIGQLTLVPFSAGEPLTHNKLSSGGQSLAGSVPEGRRAFSIPVDKVSGVAGLVRPGDMVDVFYISGDNKAAGSSGQASLLLQSIQVLAVGEMASEHSEKADSTGTITLALTPQESELTLFALARGILHLGLRPSGDTRLVSLRGMGASDLNNRSNLKNEEDN